MRNEPAAKDLMKHPVRQLKGSTTVPEAAGFLLRSAISGALVVDEHGDPMGVFTQKDMAVYLQKRLLKPLAAEEWERLTVADVMTPGIVTVAPEAPLGEVARLMTRWKFHRVFVEQDAAIVGIITSMDVLRWMAGAFPAKKSEGKAVNA